MLNIEQVGFTDLEKERNARWMSKQGKTAVKTLQCGIQYYIFAQKQMREKIAVLQEYAAKQQEELAKVNRLVEEEKQRTKQYKATDERLNEQALHFEIMINRLRPDLLTKAHKNPLDPIVRPDVRSMPENPSKVARDILVEKGILKDATKPTALLDQFTGTVPLTSEEQQRIMVESRDGQTSGQYMRRGTIETENDAMSQGAFSADFRSKEN